VHMDFVPQKRQRVKTADFDLSSLEMTSPSARGARMAPKPVGKLKFTAAEKPVSKSSKKGPKGKTSLKKASKGRQGDLF